MFNLLLAVVHHGQLLLSSSVFSSNTWLTEEEGVVAPPFHSIMLLIRTLWPYGWKDLSHFWIWHGENLAHFLLQRKSIISSYWALRNMPSNANFRAGWGGRVMLSVNAGRKDSYSSPSCYFSPSSNGWYFDFWPILVPDLLHDVLHLLTYFMQSKFYAKLVEIVSAFSHTVRPDWIYMRERERVVPLYRFLIFKFRSWIFEKTSKFWAPSCKN